MLVKKILVSTRRDFPAMSRKLVKERQDQQEIIEDWAKRKKNPRHTHLPYKSRTENSLRPPRRKTSPSFSSTLCCAHPSLPNLKYKNK